MTTTTKEALADATAGVCGSLVALLAFYPIDVLKTNLQLETNTTRNHGESFEKFTSRSINDQNKIDDFCNKTRKTSTDYTHFALQKRNYITSYFKVFFRGLHYKTAHTVSSSFAYFFIYSWIKSRHRQYYFSNGGGRGQQLRVGTEEIPYEPKTLVRLMLSAVAAMLNTTLTLPLDVLAARSQTIGTRDSINDDDFHNDSGITSSSRHLSNDKTKEMMDRVWDDVHSLKTSEEGYDTAEEGEKSCEHNESYPAAISSEEKKIETFEVDENDNNRSNGCGLDNLLDLNMADDEIHELSPKTEPMFRIDSLSHLPSLFRKTSEHQCFNKNLTGLWSGLWPSLLLCSNPSIHFTVFDIVKEYVLKYKHHSMTERNFKLRLGMGEAFIIGMIAKFVATIVTYPLIRAKVMLMVSKSKKSSLDADFSKDGGGLTMRRLLCDIFASDGISGLYKGCSLQLIHTLLKSALLMMVRERISVTTRRLILGER